MKKDKLLQRHGTTPSRFSLLFGQSTSKSTIDYRGFEAGLIYDAKDPLKVKEFRNCFPKYRKDYYKALTT